MNFKSIFIGGLLPTVMLGLGAVLMKLSMRAGSSVPNYLVQVGGTVFFASDCWQRYLLMAESAHHKHSVSLCLWEWLGHLQSVQWPMQFLH